MRAEKQLLLDEIKEKIDKSKGYIVANYQNFSAGQSREFRDKLAEVGAEFEVVRKRVFIKAAGVEFDKLDGHIGVVFAYEDPTQAAKSTVKYGEDNNETLKVLAGYIEGEHCSAEEIEVLAKLPTLPELRAQFLGLLEAPMSHTVGAVQAILSSILYCMEEKGKKS